MTPADDKGVSREELREQPAEFTAGIFDTRTRRGSADVPLAD